MSGNRNIKQYLGLFSRLVESVYESAYDPEHWRYFLEGLCRALNAKSGMFRVIDDATPAIRANIHYNLDPELQQAHRNYYVNQDIFIQALRDKPGGYIASNEQMVDPRRMELSEFYADYMRPQDSYHVCGGLAMRNETFMVKFGVQRHYNAGSFSREDIEFIRRFVPHIRRATHLGQLLDGADRKANSAENALDKLGLGLILLDEHGRIVHTNREADLVLQGHRSLDYSLGVLRATRTADAGPLRTILETVLERAKRNGPPVPEAMLLTPGPGEPQMLVAACPVPADHTLFQGPWPRVAVSVFISNLEDAGLLNREVLVKLYGLTDAEARLASELSRGRKISGISAELGVSPHTLRTQLKQVFAKTGVHGQAQLVRLLTGKPWNLIGGSL